MAGALSIPFINNPSMSAVDDYRIGLSPILNKSLNTSQFSETDAKNYPGTVKKEFGPDSFYFKTQTAFGTFSIEIANTNYLLLKETLTNNDVSISRIVVNNQTMTELWTLKTNTFTLKSKKSMQEVTEEFTNPNGYCKKIKNLGAVHEECSGNVQSIEPLWKNAKNMMKEYADKLNKVSNSVSLPNVRTGLSTSQWDF